MASVYNHGVSVSHLFCLFLYLFYCIQYHLSSIYFLVRSYAKKEKMYKANTAYKAVQRNDISLEIGDEVDNIKDIGNGWLLGRNLRTGEKGSFPESYTDRNTSVSSAIVRRFTKFKPTRPSKGPKVTVLNDNVVDPDADNTDVPMKSPALLKKMEEGSSSTEAAADQVVSDYQPRYHRLKDEYGKVQKHVQKAANITKEKAADMSYKVLKSEENQFILLKTIWRIFAAILATGILYMLLYFSFGYDLLDAGYIIIGMFLFFLIGFTFFKLIRCVILLMVPNLFTGRGRALFLSIITGLLLSGPMINISNNTDELSTSLGCTADLIYNQTQALRKQLEEPLRELARKLQSYMYELKLIIIGLTTALEPLTSALNDLSSSIQTAIDKVTALIQDCKNGLTSAKTSCTNGMNSAKSTCQNAIDSINPTDEAWNAVEGATNWFKKNGLLRRKRDNDLNLLETKRVYEHGKKGKPTSQINQNISALNLVRFRSKRGVCDVLNVGSSVCNIGSSLSSICDPFTYLENKLKAASEAMLTALSSVETFFAFEFQSDFGLSGTVNYSKNASTVVSEVKADILSRIEGIISFLTTINNILGLTLILLFIKSLLYIKNYRTKDYYDNFYITRDFIIYDYQGKKGKQEKIPPLKTKKEIVKDALTTKHTRSETNVLPLQTKEEFVKYVLTTKLTLSPRETRTLKKDLKIVFFHVIISTLTIGFDYVLYYGMTLVANYGNVALTVEGISTIDVEISGNGIFAVILRTVVDNLNLNSTFSVDLNFTTCLPTPSHPDISNIPVLALLYLIAIFFVVMQGYGLRLRHKIASSFYPEQEVERIHYLHEKIIHERMTFKGWLKDHIFSRRKEGEIREKISFRAYLVYRAPFLSKFLNICLPPKRSCLSCDKAARRGMIFKKCENTSCNALYCEDCFELMKKYCLVCDTRNELSKG